LAASLTPLSGLEWLGSAAPRGLCPWLLSAAPSGLQATGQPVALPQKPHVVNRIGLAAEARRR
jgi:hypothetical protein